MATECPTELPFDINQNGEYEWWEIATGVGVGSMSFLALLYVAFQFFPHPDDQDPYRSRDVD